MATLLDLVLNYIHLGSNENHKVKPLDCSAVRLGGLWSVTTCKSVLLRSNSNLEFTQICVIVTDTISTMELFCFVFNILLELI